MKTQKLKQVTKVTIITICYFKRKNSKKRYYERIHTTKEDYILRDQIVKLMQDYKIKKEFLHSIDINTETVTLYNDHIARECCPYDTRFLTRQEFLNLNL